MFQDGLIETILSTSLNSLNLVILLPPNTWCQILGLSIFWLTPEGAKTSFLNKDLSVRAEAPNKVNCLSATVISELEPIWGHQAINSQTKEVAFPRVAYLPNDLAFPFKITGVDRAF